MTTTFKPTLLFGGAITVNLPTDFADVSDIREIPSNQEVYLQTAGLSSVIVEILEYAAPPDHPCATDSEALKYHYADMVEAGHVREGTEEEEETRLFGGTDVHMERLLVAAPGQAIEAGVRVMSLVGTQTPRETREGQKVDLTALLLTLVRLPGKQTDILVTVNVPHARGEYDPAQVDLEKGRMGPLVEKGLQIRTEIWKTFEIVDWGLLDG